MDDKKKTIIVIALFLVVICVGAFQFTSISGPKENTAVKQKADKEKKLTMLKQQQLAEEQYSVPNPLFAKALPERDPFSPGVLNELPDEKATPTPARQERPRNFESFPKLPPFNPEITGSPLPGTSQTGNIGLSPSAQIRQPDEFAYTLKGVMVGERPAAVLQDDEGNQRLVALGDSIDGDSRVTSIARGKVTVRHKGKTVTLTVGANTNEKHN
jgi:hypothetical protein